MQIGISSASLYPQLRTEAAVVNIAALGCRHVEVFLQTRREYSPAFARGLAQLCRSLGVQVLSLHAASAQFEPMLFYTYRRQYQDGLDTLNQVLEAAAILGARCHVFHGPLRVENPEGARVAERLHQVAEIEASWGIKLALENVSWGVGCSPEVFDWLNQQEIANLYYTFDSKQARRSGFPSQDYIQAMGNRLINVHLSDGHGGVPPASYDFSGVAHRLRACGYQGPIILETYGSKVDSVGQLRASWQRLSKIFS